MAKKITIWSFIWITVAVFFTLNFFQNKFLCVMMYPVCRPLLLVWFVHFTWLLLITSYVLIYTSSNIDSNYLSTRLIKIGNLSSNLSWNRNYEHETKSFWQARMTHLSKMLFTSTIYVFYTEICFGLFRALITRLKCFLLLLVCASHKGSDTFVVMRLKPLVMRL